MRVFRHRADERDRLAVGRPARRVVAGRVIGDLRQRAAVRVDHPDVGVVALVERLAGAIRHERDLPAVRRPLRIAVVPVVAGGELRRAADRDVDHPEMRALVVEPAAVVELVVGVLVVAHVARRLRRVARPAAADDDEPASPSGDHWKLVTPFSRLVTRRGSPPPSGSSHTCVRGVSAAASPGAGRADRNAIALPSGLQRGLFDDCGAVVSATGFARAVRRHRPDRAAPAVLLLIDGRDDERDRRAVGREARIAQRLEREVVLGRHAARLRSDRRAPEDERQ